MSATKYFRKALFTSLLSFCFSIFFSNPIQAQCVTGAASAPAVFDGVSGEYNVACDAGNVNITGSSGFTAASNIVWTNGNTGDFVFSPDCNDLGQHTFTPCIPAGTNIPQQCFTIDPVIYDGAVSAGGSGQIMFNITGFCYAPGANYSGQLAINLSGGGDISISVTDPTGAILGPLTLDIGLINSLSPIPISLLGLSGDPNGTWTITLADAGAGAFTYDIQGGSEICIDGFTTTGLVCGDPVVVNVFGACPTFVSAQASSTTVCSGEAFDLSATLNPDGAPNVTYSWSGSDGFASTLANPSPAPTNTTCDPIVIDYTLDIVCTNDGSPVVTGQVVQVTVNPEIDLADVVVDNTTNVLDPNCSVIVSYPSCPGFTVNGQPTQDEQFYTPGDNGTSGSFIISSGAGCELEVNPAINCLSTCVLADVVVVTTACDASNEFSIDVTVNSMGDSPSFDLILSDGTVMTINATGGPFNFGPFPSGTVINITVIDPGNPSCNQNLGYFTENCFVCPNITTLDPVADGCVGSSITLNATTDSGVEGVDYSIQWYENGVPIAGGNTASFNHTLTTTDRCNVTSSTFTAELTCLNGGTASTTNSMSTPSINIYPIPENGIDFSFGSCSVTPIDNCGGTLNVNLNGATDPAPGGSTTVNYDISVAGAPAACVNSGSTTVSCPNCPDYPGDGTTTEQVLCWGDNFTISNNNALTTSLGYEVGYVITPNPPGSYANSAALLAASIGGVRGAYTAPGSITNNNNFTNDGSLIAPANACGELLYFTPFVSFTCSSINNYVNDSGNMTAPAPPSLGTPGIGGGSLTLPAVPYCDGLVTYNIELCVDDNTVDGQEPLAQDALLGLITGLPGGVFSNFPNLNNIHDSCDEFLGFCVGPECYQQNGWTLDPSGESFNVVMVNLLWPGTINMGYDLTLDVNCNSSFPTICPDCEVTGAPVAVRFLPEVTLAAIAPPANLCDGDAIDLITLNPAPSLAVNGTFSWYQGASGGGNAVADATELIPPVGTTQYCVALSYCETGDCVVETCVDITVDPLPAMAPPTLTPLCPGESVDLTSFENEINGGGGTFSWSIFDPVTGHAQLADPTSITPLGSEQYCATYTDGGTLCPNEICFSFTYSSLPVMLNVLPTACTGDQVDLADLENSINPGTGTWSWYDNDPNAGGNLITPTTVTPTNGQVYWVEFTDGGTGCRAISSVTYTVNPLPLLIAPTSSVCENGTVDLTSLDGGIPDPADPNAPLTGTIVWYLGDPGAGGTLLDGTPGNDPTTQTPTAADLYCAVFTDNNTNCSDQVCFNYTIDPLPVINNFQPPAACADTSPFDVTSFEGSLGTGTFAWYDDDPAGAGVLLPDVTNVNQANGTTEDYWFTITDPLTNCMNTGSINLEVYQPVVGATAVYDCGSNQLVVDVTGATGGSGTGYTVAAGSANQNGDVLNEGDNWSVTVEDDNGCQQTVLTGTVQCNVACTAAVGTPPTHFATVCSPAGPLAALAPLPPADYQPANAGNPAVSVYTFVVTDPNDTGAGAAPGGAIVDFTADGSFDMSGLAIGDERCFWALTYDQDWLDAVICDPVNQALMAGLGIALPCGASLADVFTDPVIQGLTGPLDVAGALGALPTLCGILTCPTDPLCYDVVAQPFCVEVIDCGGCPAQAGSFCPEPGP